MRPGLLIRRFGVRIPGGPRSKPQVDGSILPIHNRRPPCSDRLQTVLETTSSSGALRTCHRRWQCRPTIAGSLLEGSLLGPGRHPVALKAATAASCCQRDGAQRRRHRIRRDHRDGEVPTQHHGSRSTVAASTCPMRPLTTRIDLVRTDEARMRPRRNLLSWWLPPLDRHGRFETERQ